MKQKRSFLYLSVIGFVILLASILFISCDPNGGTGGGKAYIVDFDRQGGVSSSLLSIEVTNGATYGTLATASRPGYTFEGWWTEAGGNGDQINATSTVTITSDQTLYAKWNPLSYTVTFDEQDGDDPSIASKIVTNGSDYGTLATVERYAYTFAGWWTEAEGNGEEITETTTVNLTADQTLYAKWVLETFTITFEAQGGANLNPASKIVNFNDLYGELATVDRVGYTFDGWWTEAGGNGDQINATSTVTITSDQTLYAKWNPLSYTVTFDEQDGDDPSIASKIVTNGSDYGTLATVERYAYTFAGWWTEAEGNGEEITETTTVNLTADQTLYAKWVLETFTITFEAQGGANLNPASKIVNFNDLYGELATVDRVGYTFDGWWTGIGGTGTKIITASNTERIQEDKTLYASWIAIRYTVTFDVQGGSAVDPTQKSVWYDSPYDTLETPEKPGYTFSGWWTDSDGLDSKIEEDSIVAIAADHTLYAKWEFSAEGAIGTLVFYDKGFESNGWRYLEAAPADVRVVNEVVTCNSGLLDYATSPETYIFGIYRTTSDGDPVLVGGTQDGIGYGENNTYLLEYDMENSAYISTDDLVPTTTIRYAAKLCRDLIYAEKDDWFLPSWNELLLMHEVLRNNGKGDFSAGDYWSSTESSASSARTLDFETVSTGNGTIMKDYIGTVDNLGVHVRAVRAF
jgi:uncharacterized repeat protein (TIGR02543 family)